MITYLFVNVNASNAVIDNKKSLYRFSKIKNKIKFRIYNLIKLVYINLIQYIFLYNSTL